MNAKDGAYEDYLKPLFHDLDFRTASDKEKSLGKKVKGKVVSVVASVLKNDDNQQVATKTPFAGNFADNELDVWTTVANLLRNAFVQAIRGGLEGQNPRTSTVSRSCRSTRGRGRARSLRRGPGPR